MPSLFASLLPLALCLALLGSHGVVAHPAPASASKGPAAGLVAKVCANSNHKDLCFASLQSVPDVGSTPNVGVLVIAALRFAASNASDTAVVIQGLLNDTTLDAGIQQALSDCADHYTDAVEQLDNSVAAVTANAYGDLLTWVKTAIADADACEAGFQQLATGKSTLSHRNLIFRQLCNNALGIAKFPKA